MWKPGQLVQIQQRIPIEGTVVILSSKCRVIKNSGVHRCLNCPMQQKYCDINKCEQMLPLNLTLKNAQQDSGECES